MADEEIIEETTEVAPEAPKETETKQAAAAPASGSPSIIKAVVDSLVSWVKTTKAKAAIIGFICITAGLYGLFTHQANSIEVKSLDDVLAGATGGGGGGGGGKDPFAKYVDMTGRAPLQGSATEGQTDTKKVSVEDLNVWEVKVVITWIDEPDSARHTNNPDSFEVVVTSPDGREVRDSASNTHGQPGTFELDLTRNITKEALNNKDLKKKTKETTWTGEWSINVTCTAAGDQEAMFSIIGLRDQADNGNTYDLEVVWTFKGEEPA